MRPPTIIAGNGLGFGRKEAAKSPLTESAIESLLCGSCSRRRSLPKIIKDLSGTVNSQVCTNRRPHVEEFWRQLSFRLVVYFCVRHRPPPASSSLIRARYFSV